MEVKWERTGRDGTLIWAHANVMMFYHSRTEALSSWLVSSRSADVLVFFSRCFLWRPCQVSSSNTYSISSVTSVRTWLQKHNVFGTVDGQKRSSAGDGSARKLTWCEKGWSCIVWKSCPVILFPSRLLFRRDGKSYYSTHHQFPPLLTFHKHSSLWRFQLL